MLTRDMINDSCWHIPLLQAKITTNIIMFNYERTGMRYYGG